MDFGALRGVAGARTRHGAQPEPLPSQVVPFVLEAHRHAVLSEAPQRFAQHVVEFSFPIGGEERDDLFAAGDELVTVAPQRVGCVGEAYAVGSRVFHASSAAWTFVMAESMSKGGNGGWVSVTTVLSGLRSVGVTAGRWVVVIGDGRVRADLQQVAGGDLVDGEVD